MANLTAYDFATHVGGESGAPTRYRFGVEATAEALRSLAARIDAGDIIVREAKVETRAVSDEFTGTVLTLSFAERQAEGG